MANLTPAPQENMVVIKLPAAWYAKLLNELEFSVTIVSSRDGHSRENCRSLWEELVRQGHGIPAEYQQKEGM